MKIELILVLAPVGLVVEIGPSWHQTVKPEPGSPAPKLWVQPGCKTHTHPFHLQANVFENSLPRPEEIDKMHKEQRGKDDYC